MIAVIIIAGTATYLGVNAANNATNNHTTTMALGNTPVQGWYKWTWSADSSVPDGTNMVVLFSGWSDVLNAISDSAHAKSLYAVPVIYLSLGGGNVSGRFTASVLQKFVDNVSSVKAAGYTGICFDVEEGDANLASNFKDAFAACKRAGLKVLVTTSHSAPYGIADASTLLNSWVTDPNIDILSPQLYTSGIETAPNYETSMGVSWSTYMNAIPQFVPSIVSVDQYLAAQKYFADQGIKTNGYMIWKQ